MASALLNPVLEQLQMKPVLGIAAILLICLIGYSQGIQNLPYQKPIKVSLDVVLVPVTVTDDKNRPVEGLQAESFQIWEDKVQQKIEYFSSEDTPVSVGLVFDSSGSMRQTLNTARNAATTFLKTGNPSDEYFMVEFSDAPRMTRNFSNDINALQNHLAFSEAHGYTAFLDAVYLALQNVRLGSHPRRALLMITDGEDNHSRYTLDDIKDALKESDVQLYAVGTGFGHSFKRRDVGRELLVQLAELTGGRAVFPNSVEELEEACAQISLELKNQYVLGYVPSNTAADGRWHRLRVRVTPPGGVPHLNVRARSGYFATPAAF
jgi:Ca-activated chloride channel homolog